MILRRGDKDTQKNYTEKNLNDPDNHNSVCDHSSRARHPGVKWALGSIITNKASGGDGIPAEPFQILKDDAVKVLQIWNTQQWPQDWKGSVFITTPKKGNAKEWSNYCQLLISQASSRLCAKSFKPGFKST